MIIGSKTFTYEILPSTNTEALNLLKAGEPDEGIVISADYQSAGRGQPGNRWESEKGKNLLISIIVYPESVAPEDQFLLSMMTSLGLYDLLKSYFKNVRIKWPNDIYAGNDKIAGILIENCVMGDRILSAIIGIGLNVNQEKFPEYIGNPVSMKILAGIEYERNHVMEELLSKLDIRYKQLLYGNRSVMKNEYISHLYRLGEWNEYKASNVIFRGKIIDVTNSGLLKIEKENGSVSGYAFKEVDYLL